MVMTSDIRLRNAFSFHGLFQDTQDRGLGLGWVDGMRDGDRTEHEDKGCNA